MRALDASCKLQPKARKNVLFSCLQTTFDVWKIGYDTANTRSLYRPGLYICPTTHPLLLNQVSIITEGHSNNPVSNALTRIHHKVPCSSRFGLKFVS